MPELGLLPKLANEVGDNPDDAGPCQDSDDTGIEDDGEDAHQCTCPGWLIGNIWSPMRLKHWTPR